MITTSTKGLQQAQAQLKKELAKLQSTKSVLVGIQEGSGNHPDSEITNAELGAILHFGTSNGHIPARPWLDVGVEQGNREYANIMQDGIEAELPIDTMLNQVGLYAVGQVQQYMTELNSPANADSTIAKKGSSNPLIDQGTLRSSVTHKLTTEKPEEGLV